MPAKSARESFCVLVPKSPPLQARPAGAGGRGRDRGEVAVELGVVAVSGTLASMRARGVGSRGWPWSVAILASLASPLACGGPTPSVRGWVSTPPTAPGASPVAVPGARVTVLCAGREPQVLGATDDAGRFAREVDADVSNACWIVAEKPGFFSEKVRVLDACARSRAWVDRCSQIVVTAHLAPRHL